MKKQITRILCIMLLISSCSEKKDDPQPEPPQPPPVERKEYVAVTAKNPNVDTKTELLEDGLSLKWAKGDKITVFMQSQVDNKLHSAEYLIDDHTVDTETPLFKGELLWQKESTDHTFYSCYPYIEGCKDVKKLPISLPAEQQQVAATTTHLAQLDILISSPVTQKAPAVFSDSFTSVPMFYRHIFAIIEIRFFAKNADLRINRITMKSNQTHLSVTEGFVDLSLSADDPMFCKTYDSKGENKVSLTVQDSPSVPVLQKETPDAGNTFSTYLVVAPGAHTDGMITFQVETTSGKQYEFSRSGRLIQPADKLIVYLELSDDYLIN